MKSEDARRRWLILILLAGVGGAIAGCNYMANWGGHSYRNHPGALLILGLFISSFVLAFCLISYATGRLLSHLDAETQAWFRRYDLLAYSPVLILASGVWGVQLMSVGGVFLLIALLHLPVFTLAISGGGARQVQTSQGYLAFLFLISGFAALIYQIVWQRTLFEAYGVNIESITLIVSLFMFGLGLGSFVGGAIADKYPARAPELFFLCECGIGAFGVVSLPLIHHVSQATSHASLAWVSIVIFVLLCLPTMLMGATLPILVGHLYRYSRNVGKSVGTLYAINTIGSAIACFVTADILFIITGQQGAVTIAAACNLAVGFLVWQYSTRLAQANSASGVSLHAPEGPPAPAPQKEAPFGMKVLVLFFAAAAGYVSLSQEMLWMRLVSFMTGGAPSDFAHVLGMFLIGVALGALFGKRLCGRGLADGSPATLLGGLLIGSAICYYFSIASIAAVRNQSMLGGFVLAHFVVVLSAFLLGGIFTILCHYLANSGKSVGLLVSRVYVANIVGSVLGPLLTGFYLMDRFGMDKLVLGLSLATLLLGGAAYCFGNRQRLAGPVVALSSCAVLLVCHGSAFERFYERLQGGHKGQSFKHVIENRSGVLTTLADGKGDIIFGGGIYDGRFCLDPVSNANGIQRCYFIAALHPQPEEILEIGLSGGSWARVLLDYTVVNKLTTVEINPGYVQLARCYPSHQTLFEEPRFELHIDDGRRWLKRNPDRRFDVILQNTTFYWRSHASSLLSIDYFTLCKQHLKPGGVVYVNTTGCLNTYHTLAHVFRHVVCYHNFVAASDSPFTLNSDQTRSNLLKFVDAKGTTFDRPETRPILEKLSKEPLLDEAPRLLALKRVLATTDDNMATEYKTGRRCLEWRMFGD